jgi:hypothetical protein
VTIRWAGDLKQNLARIAEKSQNLTDDAADGAKVILKDAVDRAPRAPKKDGDNHPHLEDTGKVNKVPQLKGTASITFAGPYARYVHEHLGFKHPYGGEAKFLEVAMLMHGGDAIKAAGNHFWRRL